jgi:hypothetical protein
VSTIHTLECCCCGESTKGRQWYNRDYGYGVCPACGPKFTESDVGKRGVHWDIQQTAQPAEVSTGSQAGSPKVAASHCQEKRRLHREVTP